MSASSSTQVPRMRLCPCCDGLQSDACALCKGDRFVTHFKAASWQLEQGRSMDTPLPDTDRDPNK